MVSQLAAMPPIIGNDDIAWWNGPCCDAAPEFLEPRHAVRRVIAGDQARVDRADRRADHPVRLDAGLMQCLIDARPDRRRARRHPAAPARPARCSRRQPGGRPSLHRAEPLVIGASSSRRRFCVPGMYATRRARHVEQPGQGRRTLPHTFDGHTPCGCSRRQSRAAAVNLNVAHVSAPSSRHRPAMRRR